MAKTLTVFLAADLKKFNGGMKDARREVEGFGGSLKNKLGPAFIAAGAAAGAFAVKLAVDGVKAAMEDQKAVAALAKTLDNLKLSHDTRGNRGVHLRARARLRRRRHRAPPRIRPARQVDKRHRGSQPGPQDCHGHQRGHR
jgi:alkyl sulfatase BDS1-like metallo-beta-lactamase superfamily hydrolase